MKIVSWNVNGLNRCRWNDFLKFLADVNPDIMCCQEIKGSRPLRPRDIYSFGFLPSVQITPGHSFLQSVSRSPTKSVLAYGIRQR